MTLKKNKHIKEEISQTQLCLIN